jgi:threonine/homoserine/homoserine lactone efflux protein
MFDAQVIQFSIAVAILTMTPGNDTVLVLRNAAGRGRRAGFATLLGVCAGLVVHGAFSALGISVILLQSSEAFNAVRLLGAGYLMVLGGQSLWAAYQGGRLDLNSSDTAQPASPQSATRSFGEGVLTNVLNPKVALFYLSFLPQFIQPTDSALKPLMLAGIHATMGIVWLSIVVIMVNASREVLARPSVKRRFDTLTGLVLMAFGIRLALEK